ncbi:MAG: cytidylate kinase-like family protein [Solobacterium sp.]|nr:cytidylate kinase-like family protein [Solobacterium sp.]
MKNKIITISRQYGSGGSGIGRRCAELLGLDYYGSRIIAQIADESGFDFNYIRDNSENADGGGFFAAMISPDFYSYSNRDEIWKLQCRIISDISEKGPCIIVGRCADYILKDKADLFRVFVYADKEDRIKRITEVYHEGGDNPEKHIRDNDKRRQAYYEIYTDQKFGDYHNYDLCLNSSTLGIETCAQMIAEGYRKTTEE